MDKKTRTYEEIITLQDKAIEALTQANAALVMALEALKKARAEQGLPLQFPGFSWNGVKYGQIGSSVPQSVPQLTMSSGMNTADNVLSVSNLISQAGSQKTLAQGYIAAYQASVKEQDALPKVKVGGCL